MNRRRVAVFAALAAVIIIAAVFTSFLVTGSADRNAPSIVLPPEISNSPDAQPDLADFGSPAPAIAELTADNLSDVILTMQRPDEYFASYMITLYWDEYTSTTVTEIWSSGGLRRINAGERVTSTNQSYIVAGDTTYIWREGEKTYYKGKTGEFGADDNAGVPTYEDLAAIPANDVTTCYYSTLEASERPCIYAETVDALGQTVKWWVTLDDGLLYACEIVDGDQRLYYCYMRLTEIAAVASDRFLLPDGNQITE